MNQVSVAGVGVYVSVIEMILHAFGITPEPGTILGIINDVITVSGWILIIFGQLKRADLHVGLIRK